MASKQELIARLKELLEQTDAEQHADAVETIKEAYETLVSHEQQAADQASPDTEATEPAAEATAGAVPLENAKALDEDDRQFKRLIDAFNQKVNDVQRERTRQELENLAAKKAVMDELRQLVTGEENIGSAFQRFTELAEKWRSIGPVPQNAYRDLQRDYGHLRDEFFYHIRIYKELRDHDLKKNTALKRALISDMEAVQRVESVKEAEALVKEYQERWHQIGPVLKEEWEAVRDGFWNATRVVYERIHEHYKARRAEQDANLEAKKGLIEKVRALAASIEEPTAKQWHALTDQVLEFQAAWKSIGFAARKENEKAWKEFREVCSAFFDRKKGFFNALKDQNKEARDKKTALIEKAEALKDRTDWKATGDQFRALQTEWKSIGWAGKEDQRLWNRFREACDAFYNARNAHFEKIDSELADNVKAREELIGTIEGFALSGERGKDLATLKDFSQRWMNGGRVPPKQYDAFFARFRAAMDKHYGALNVAEDERRQMRFQEHVSGLKSGPDAKFQLEKEVRFIKRKIEELEQEALQYENKMGMFNFKSAEGEAMKKDMEKKVERLRRDIERLRTQHKDLRKEMNAKQPAPETVMDPPASAGDPAAPPRS